MICRHCKHSQHSEAMHCLWCLLHDRRARGMVLRDDGFWRSAGNPLWVPE